MWVLVFFHPPLHALLPSTLSIHQKVSSGPGWTLVPRGHPGKWNAYATWLINSFIELCETGLPECQWHDDFYWLSNTGYRTSSTPTDHWLKLCVWAHVSTLLWLGFMVVPLTLSTQGQPRMAAGILYSMWPQLKFSPASIVVKTLCFPSQLNLYLVRDISIPCASEASSHSSYSPLCWCQWTKGRVQLTLTYSFSGKVVVAA